MANFESGVTGYVTGTATVKAYFPIKKNGDPDIKCIHCLYYNGRNKCTITHNENGGIVNFPEHGIGYDCPLEFETEGENNE